MCSKGREGKGREGRTWMRREREGGEKGEAGGEGRGRKGEKETKHRRRSSVNFERKMFLPINIFFLGGGNTCPRLLRLWKGGDKSPTWLSQNLGNTANA